MVAGVDGLLDRPPVNGLPPRPLPAVTPQTAHYWQGGRDGVLRLQGCSACDRLLHPSMVVCPDHPQAAPAPVDLSGRGRLIGVTVNEQSWHPAFPPPYVLGIVALEEDPRVRLTTTIVGADAGEAAVGAPVEVRFEHVEDVWLPVFAPVPDTEPSGPADGGTRPPLPEVRTRPPATPDRFEHRVAFTGVGMSEIGRRLMRPPISLTVDACLAAVADAGLELSDIDGLSTYPGGALGGGISEGGITPLEEALRIQPVWHNGGSELPGQCGSVVAAMLAVAAGLCRHVLCFRTVWEATATQLQRTGQMAPQGGGRISGDMQYRLPYGAMSASSWIAMAASQYMHRFGVDREVLGRIAVNGRTNAGRNPEAIYRDPMTLDDYFAARMVSSPFGLYDCDVPCDGSVAIVVSARDVAADLRQPPVWVEAVGTQITERVSWDQGTVTHLSAVFGPAAHLWTRTDLTPADVDVAEIYDGFSFNCLSWMEGLGFCGVGEATDFIGDGRRIALDGELPLNTHGGQLSAGRTHGYGFLREGILQMRGQARAGQVPDAEVAAVAVGGGVPAGCMLLTAAR